MQQPSSQARWESWVEAHHVSITIIAALVAIGVSGYAARMATKANTLAEEGQRFSRITAESQWIEIVGRFDDVDNELLEWEEGNNLKREGSPIESVQFRDQEQIRAFFKDFKGLKEPPPRKIILAYQKRAELYLSLRRISDQYAPFKERLAAVKFVVPPPPLLPVAAGFSGGVMGGVKR
ncbi:MAG: hypothetical protein WAN11_09895 [Syntrophobacteraceae bacterium]